jgi:hypothetical protein
MNGSCLTNKLLFTEWHAPRSFVTGKLLQRIELNKAIGLIVIGQRPADKGGSWLPNQMPPNIHLIVYYLDFTRNPGYAQYMHFI